MIYDLLFFFILIIIVLNLIFGVIIDTFADLRSEKQQKDDVLKNTCFICGTFPGVVDIFIYCIFIFPGQLSISYENCPHWFRNCQLYSCSSIAFNKFASCSNPLSRANCDVIVVTKQRFHLLICVAIILHGLSPLRALVKEEESNTWLQ